MLQELTDERTSQDGQEWIDELLHESISRCEVELVSQSVAQDKSQVAVDVRPARKRGRPRATPEVD